MVAAQKATKPDLRSSDNPVVISDRLIAETSGFFACATGPNALFIATNNEKDYRAIIEMIA